MRLQRLVMDLGRCRSRHNLSSVSRVYDFLEGLSLVAGMRVAVPPVVARFPIERGALEGQQDFGVSGVVVWIESHAAVHTWPEECFVAVEVSSCKAFDEVKVLEFSRRFWRAERVDWQGVRTPSNAAFYVG